MGKIDKDVKGVPYTSKYVVSKVARVAKNGRDWSEFKLGETLLHLYEEDSGDDDSSCYKLYVFRSLDVSVGELNNEVIEIKMIFLL